MRPLCLHDTIIKCLSTGVNLKGLRKRFGKKVAVRGSDLRLYEGQVLSLLGHNGAGKTTTMSMLTGLYPPSSGTATIGGHDIRTNLAGAQDSLGICPQHDVLFDSLTVEEHLIFFCELKGVRKLECMSQVEDMIESLGLSAKRNDAASTLSGGQKRRLSCGIAIVGGSKVVILDEPTSGVDPSARRAIWDLISKYKHGRTVLLSTHFMDEADVLGDRIAIMADGVIKCCGSSLFLKRRHGAGYSLTMLKDQTDCNSAAVGALVRKHVPSATVQSEIGSELAYLLPRESASAFEALFGELESSQASLGISGYGCSITTLEEVFLKVGEGNAGANDQDEEPNVGQVDIAARIKARRMAAAEKLSADCANVGDEPLLTDAAIGVTGGVAAHYSGFSLKYRQFKALIRKRLYNSSRSKMVSAAQLIPPLFFTIISLILAKTYFAVSDSPPLDLDALQAYGANTLWVATSATDPAQNTPEFRNLTAPWRALAGGVQTVSSVEFREGENASSFLAVMAAGGNSSGTGANALATYTFNRANLVMLELQCDAGPGESCDDVTGVSPVGWFNGEGIHSLPQSLTLLDSGVASMFVPGMSLTVNNAPLPRTAAEVNSAQQQSAEGFNIAFSILFGMAPLASSFLIFLVKEKESKAKHIQFVSGVDPASYWLSGYLWDFANFLLPSVGCLLIFLAFDVEAFTGERFGLSVMLFVLYGISVIPLMYLASFLFSTPSIAFTRMTLFNIATGLAAMITVTILTTIEPDTASAVRQAFLFLPNYCFGQGLTDLYANYQAHEYVVPLVDTKLCPIIELLILENKLPNMTTPCDASHLKEVCAEIVKAPNVPGDVCDTVLADG